MSRLSYFHPRVCIEELKFQICITQLLDSLCVDNDLNKLTCTMMEVGYSLSAEKQQMYLIL